MLVHSEESIQRESGWSHDEVPHPGIWDGRAGETRGRRILIVDDNQDVVESFAILLELEGHQCIAATDGESALRMFEELRPQVALLDIGMPGRSGHEVARRIRQLAGAEVLLIAVSGWARDSDRERSLAAGFDHHLCKPVDYDELVRLVRSGTSGQQSI